MTATTTSTTLSKAARKIAATDRRSPARIAYLLQIARKATATRSPAR